MATAYLGIEIGGTKLQVTAGDDAGHCWECHRFEVNRDEGAEGIRKQLEASLPELKDRFQPAAIGVGFGGPVDKRTGRIRCSHQIAGWPDFPLRDWLSSLTQLPVELDNDANVAALGEAWHGAGRGLNPVFYVTLGSGVGGGLVCDKRIFHGAAPGESEIGHVRLDRNGTLVEERCSGWAVDSRIREAARIQPDTLLARLAGGMESGEARHLSAALLEKDPMAIDILVDLSEDLAFGLSHVTHLFHPEIIVLGGGLSLIGEPLRAATERALKRYVMNAFQPGPLIALARLQENAVPVGALVLASNGRAVR